MALIQDIIQSKHPTYVASRDAWERNERRLIGGEDVFDELTPFQWESQTDAVYLRRKSKAIWPDLPAQFAERFVGALFRSAPQPGRGLDFGSLGDVSDPLSRAAMLWEDADGIGHDARSWSGFWNDVMQMAAATRYRWVLVESRERPSTLEDERTGRRPYLVEFSPLSVPDWHFTAGRLDYARVELTERFVGLREGAFLSEDVTTHYLLVRRGFEGFGERFKVGGWWLFDDNGEPIREDGVAREGRWDATKGEIPMMRVFYESGRAKPVVGQPRASAVIHLGNIASEIMDLLSAEANDAWNAGSRKVFFLGVDREQWGHVVEAGLQGDQMVPVPAKEGGGNVSIYDLATASANEAINSAIAQRMKLATQIIMRELTTAPDASGASRRVEFLQGNSPRLSNMAENLEEAQAVALRYLEMRWTGGEPTSSVKWPRQFDLQTVLERVIGLIEAVRGFSVQSPTMLADLLITAMREEGLLTDSDEDKAREDQIRRELGAAGELSVLSAERQRIGVEADRAALERPMVSNGSAAARAAIDAEGD